MTHVPGHARSNSASSQAPVTPRQTAGNMNPEVQLSLKLATLETKLVNCVHSPEYLGSSSPLSHVAGKLFRALQPPLMVTDVLSENCLELLDAQAWRISKLEHGHKALVLHIHDLGTLLNRIVDICCKYDDFTSLQDPQKDFSQDSSQVIQPKSSAYDSAPTESACSMSTHSEVSEASDGPESVPKNPAGKDKIEVNEIKCSAQPLHKKCSPPQSVCVP